VTGAAHAYEDQVGQLRMMAEGFQAQTQDHHQQDLRGEVAEEDERHLRRRAEHPKRVGGRREEPAA
jgi:hypothetical protein